MGPWPLLDPHATHDDDGHNGRVMVTTDEEVDVDRIVVGFDGSEPAMEAVRWAAAEADRRGWDVLVVQSWREPLFGGPSWVELWEDPDLPRQRAQADLDAAVEAVASDHPAVGFATQLANDSPARAVIDASEGVSLVVVGARGRGGFSTLLLGSVSQRIVSRAATTVVVVRGDVDGDGDVVVGVDGSPTGRRALAWAAEEARLRSRKLRAVMAWTYLVPQGEHGAEPFRAEYTDADARLALRTICDEVLGPDPQVELDLDAVCDMAARALIERAADASLLVIGPGESSVPARLDLGSVSLQVLHHAPCPVALVR